MLRTEPCMQGRGHAAADDHVNTRSARKDHQGIPEHAGAGGIARSTCRIRRSATKCLRKSLVFSQQGIIYRLPCAGCRLHALQRCCRHALAWSTRVTLYKSVAIAIFVIPRRPLRRLAREWRRPRMRRTRRTTRRWRRRTCADRPGAGGRPLPLARAIRATRTPIGSGASSPRLPRAGGVMGSTTGDGR